MVFHKRDRTWDFTGANTSIQRPTVNLSAADSIEYAEAAEVLKAFELMQGNSLEGAVQED